MAKWGFNFKTFVTHSPPLNCELFIYNPLRVIYALMCDMEVLKHLQIISLLWDNKIKNDVWNNFFLTCQIKKK